MEENKDLEMNEEVTEEVTEEVAEEVAEEVTEAVEAEEDAITFDQEAIPFEATEVAEKKGSKKGLITAIVAVIVVGAMVAIGFATNILPWNKYNHMGYVNITGRTLQEVAEESGMEFDQLLKEYGLPEDMPANTEESSAYYAMPVKAIASMYGMDFATMKEMLGFSDEVTEDTAWGEAEGEVTIEKYVGKDNFDSFKEEYGFGDEVTLETKWKEVRKTVDLASKKKYDEQKAEQDKEEENVSVEETPAEETEETEAEEPETEEAPADETAE